MKSRQEGSSTTKSITKSLRSTGKEKARDHAEQERSLLVEDHLSRKEKEMIMGRMNWNDLYREQEVSPKPDQSSAVKRRR